MKTLRLMTATLALGALAIAPSFAQTAMQDNKMMDNKMNPMMAMNDVDKYKTRWVYQNLDAREVKRYKAMGFSEDTIKGAANIALRTPLSLDYVLRKVQISGMPLALIAVNYGLPVGVINEDIPGMGAENIGMMMSGMSGGMMAK